MTYTQLAKLLPRGAEAMIREHKTVWDLRIAVQNELIEFNAGTNPLTLKQVQSFRSFLAKTQNYKRSKLTVSSSQPVRL